MNTRESAADCVLLTESVISQQQTMYYVMIVHTYSTYDMWGKKVKRFEGRNSYTYNYNCQLPTDCFNGHHHQSTRECVYVRATTTIP